MTTRRKFLAALAGSLALSHRSLGEQRARVWRVGILSSHRRPDSLETNMLYGEVPRRLRELGYVEGKDLTIEWRFAGGDYERLHQLASELVKLPVDAIVTHGSEGIRAAQSATRTIPIVFMGGADLVASGFVKSLAHPGGNTTGVSLLAPDTAGKQVELLMSLVPKLSRLAVLFNSSNPGQADLLAAIRAAGEASKVQVVSVGARTPQEIEEAFSQAVRGNADALVWTLDSFLNQQARQIAALALKHRLPSITGAFEYPEAGGLMCYGANRTLLFRRVAEYVDKIFRGANPAELPVEQPTKFELVINRKTARALGLTIPPEILVQADKVIE